MLLQNLEQIRDRIHEPLPLRPRLWHPSQEIKTKSNCASSIITQYERWVPGVSSPGWNVNLLEMLLVVTKKCAIMGWCYLVLGWAGLGWAGWCNGLCLVVYKGWAWPPLCSPGSEVLWVWRGETGLVTGAPRVQEGTQQAREKIETRHFIGRRWSKPSIKFCITTGQKEMQLDPCVFLLWQSYLRLDIVT